jgi:PhnB protein
MAPKRSAKVRSRPRRRTTRPSAPKSPPAGFGSVTPYLSVEGGTAALEFYVRAFGAKELRRELTPDGKVIHGRLRIGDSMVMLSDVFPGGGMASPLSLGSSTVNLHIYTKDVDALWARAVAAGARVAMPIGDMFWGERYGQLIDPFGHHWSLSMPIRMSAAEKKAKQAVAMAQFAAGEHPARPEP